MSFLPLVAGLLAAGVVAGLIAGLLGVGGGIVVDGKVLSGANGVAGEWGHNKLPGPNVEEAAAPPFAICP